MTTPCNWEEAADSFSYALPLPPPSAAAAENAAPLAAGSGGDGSLEWAQREAAALNSELLIATGLLSSRSGPPASLERGGVWAASLLQPPEDEEARVEDLLEDEGDAVNPVAALGEAGHLLGLWQAAIASGSAAAGASTPAPAPVALDTAWDEGGGEGNEWGLPLLGIDLTLLARGGFSAEEVDGFGARALLPAALPPCHDAPPLLIAGAALAAAAWGVLTGGGAGMRSAAADPRAATGVDPLQRGSFPLPSASGAPKGGASAVVLLVPPALQTRTHFSGSMRVELLSASGDVDADLWAAASEALLASGFAFHASSATAEADATAWAKRRRRTTDGPFVLALLPFPLLLSGVSSSALWHSLAAPVHVGGAGSDALEAIRILIEGAHRDIRFKASLWTIAQELAAEAEPSRLEQRVPAWWTGAPQVLASSPLVRLTLPLLDRQFFAADVACAEADAADEAREAAAGVALEAPLRRHAAVRALHLAAASAAANSGIGVGTLPVSPWVVAAAPILCDVLDAWCAAYGSLPPAPPTTANTPLSDVPPESPAAVPVFETVLPSPSAAQQQPQQEQRRRRQAQRKVTQPPLPSDDFFMLSDSDAAAAAPIADEAPVAPIPLIPFPLRASQLAALGREAAVDGWLQLREARVQQQQLFSGGGAEEDEEVPDHLKQLASLIAEMRRPPSISEEAGEGADLLTIAAAVAAATEGAAAAVPQELAPRRGLGSGRMALAAERARRFQVGGGDAKE